MNQYKREYMNCGARRGRDFLDSLQQSPPEIWYGGKQVLDPTQFGPLKNGIASIAALYDFQWTRPELMFETVDGIQVSRSFSITKGREDLSNLGKALYLSAQSSNGMLGREPAYLNRALAAFSGSAAFFDSGGREFSDNVKNYHLFARSNDLCLTHTLLNPRINRRLGPALQVDPSIASHVVRETDAGFFVSGARLVATLPFADEIAVFPSRLMDDSEASKNYAFSFVIPTKSRGLKFICRNSVDYQLGCAELPLSSRYEEMDAVALFDDVFVPWERVFCYRNIELCAHFYDATGATAHITYQVVCKNIAKIEFYLGLISLMVHGSSLEIFQHIHEKVSEIWVGLQTMKAFKSASETGGRKNEYGLFVPDWSPLEAARFTFPRLYPRIVEIVQQIGASGLVALPSAAELDGPLKEEIAKYFQAANLDAREKIDLYRLAWDASLSAFAVRQVLYERFFFGDPVHMATRIFHNSRSSDSMERVREFLSANSA